MNFDVRVVIIVLVLIAVVVTFIVSDKKPVVDVEPSPTTDVVTPTPEIEVTPTSSPEPSTDLGDLIKPDPTPAVIIVEISEAEKEAAFIQYSAKFAEELLADSEGAIEVTTDSKSRTFTIVYNLSDEDVRDFAVAMANDPLLTYNDMIGDMIDSGTLNEFKNVMFCQHLIICLKNNDQVFAAYDVITGTERTDLIERVG